MLASAPTAPGSELVAGFEVPLFSLIAEPTIAFRNTRCDPQHRHQTAAIVDRAWQNDGIVAKKTRLIASLVVVIGALGVVGQLVLNGCQADGDSGVHVTLDLAGDDGGDTSDLFDHIFIRATADGKTGTACISNVEGNALETDAGGPDPCANIEAFSWTTPPTAASWKLAVQSRTVNFVIPKGTSVHVVAEAHLVGEPAIFTASQDIVSEVGGANLALHLTRVVPSPLPACDAVLGGALLGDAGVSPGCGQSTVACIDDCGPLHRCDSNVKTIAAACVDGGVTQIVPQTIQIAPNCANSIVTRTFAANAGCAQLGVRARMFRCLEGVPTEGQPCTKSTDCTTPQMTVSFGSLTDGGRPVDLSCIPPSIFPIDFVVQAPDIDAGPLGSSGLAVTLAVTPDPDASVCTVELDSVEVGECAH